MMELHIHKNRSCLYEQERFFSRNKKITATSNQREGHCGLHHFGSLLCFLLFQYVIDLRLRKCWFRLHLLSRGKQMEIKKDR